LAPSKLSDFFSTTCAWLLNTITISAVTIVPDAIFINFCGFSFAEVAGHLLSAARSALMSLNRMLEGCFAEIRLRKRAPDLNFRDVRHVLGYRDEQLATSRLLFLAEFLEPRIGAQRIPDRIEPKKGRCNRRWAVN